VFDQPWSAFAEGSGSSFKYRGAGGSMLLHFGQGKWKLTDRESDLQADQVDNADGVTHELRIGPVVASETILMDEVRGDLQHRGRTSCP